MSGHLKALFPYTDVYDVHEKKKWNEKTIRMSVVIIMVNMVD